MELGPQAKFVVFFLRCYWNPKLVTHWDADQVAAAFRELTSEPAANGRPH